MNAGKLHPCLHMPCRRCRRARRMTWHAREVWHANRPLQRLRRLLLPGRAR